MIVRLFKSGISNGESPVKYLIGNTDHTGQTRSVKPEVLDGDPKTTIACINNIKRKYKYTSGCLAFRDSEKPTKQQLYSLIDEFKRTFCPGLSSDHFNSLFVLHQDKGNTEVHFVFVNQEMRSGRRMSIHPPGSIAFFESYTKLTNHNMRYAQVVPDPLNLAFTDFERKTPQGRKDRANKGWVHKRIIQSVKNGQIKNRNELCKFLDDELGITVTRQGADYLSLKFPGAIKAKRFRGALYHQDADYTALLQSSIQARQPQYLSAEQFETENEKLMKYISDRAQFNTKAYLTPKLIRSMSRKLYQNISTKTITTRIITMKKDYLSIIKKMIMEALSIARDKRQFASNSAQPLPTKPQAISNITKIRNRSLNLSSPSNLLGKHHTLVKAITELEVSISETLGVMNAEKDPAKKATLYQRVIQLKLQLEKLNNELRMARLRDGYLQRLTILKQS